MVSPTISATVFTTIFLQDLPASERGMVSVTINCVISDCSILSMACPDNTAWVQQA
jgi:hypothetical protein